MNLDWDNDDLFFTYTFEDETSMFDPKARWCYGGEYYSREYKCRVPVAFAHNPDMIDWFVEFMIDKTEGEENKGFWVDE